MLQGVSPRPSLEDTTIKSALITSTAAPSENNATGTTANDNEDEAAEDVPLPKTQIFFLCLGRTVVPIAFFGIFPFINQMIFEMGIGKSEVGFYSGLIVISIPFLCFPISHLSLRRFVA